MLAIQETVSKVLGIHAPDPQELMSAVERGLPLSSLDRVVGFVAPMDAKFTYRLVARASLARRRKQDRLSSDEGARLARLASVWAFAVEVWGGAEAARRFMFEPHPLLHGRTPVDVVLENEFGRPVVEGVLGRLKYGSAA